MDKQEQVSEAYYLGAILAVVGGFLDAYTYVCRGQVFANAQTGNVVRLGYNLAERNFHDALYCVIPIFAFFIGILLTETIRDKFKEKGNLHWRQRVILIEIWVLFLVAFLPAGQLDVVATTAIAFVCSVQVQSFRKIKGNTATTTMCTGNLRSATESLSIYLQTKKKDALQKSIQYYGIIGFFLVGVIFGTIMTNLFFIRAVLICCALLAVVFAIMFAGGRERADVA